MANLGTILEAKILLICSKSVFEGFRASLLRVLKKDLKLKGSRDRFLIDFGRVWWAAGGAKIMFSLQRESNFDIFGHLKIRCLLDPQKPRFLVPFGGQVGRPNRPCGPQEGAKRQKKETKTKDKKQHQKKYQKRGQHKSASLVPGAIPRPPSPRPPPLFKLSHDTYNVQRCKSASRHPPA